MDLSQNMETEGHGQLVVIKLEGDRASAVRVLQLWKSLLVELKLLNHPLKVQCAGRMGIDRNILFRIMFSSFQVLSSENKNRFVENFYIYRKSK